MKDVGGISVPTVASGIHSTLVSTNPDYRDISEVVKACPSLIAGGKSAQLQRESVPDIPSWATAYTGNRSDAGGRSSSSVIAGQYRGVDVYVSASRNYCGSVDADMQVLADLFNAEVARLRSQP